MRLRGTGRRQGAGQVRAWVVATVALLVAATAVAVVPALDEGPSGGATGLAPRAPEAQEATGPPAAAATHARAALAIRGDEALLRFAETRGWQGTGTMTDPIRITGIDLDTRATGLRLQGTTHHIVIDGAVVRSAEGDGIHLHDAPHVRITGAQLSGGTAAIRVTDTVDVHIANSTLESARYGILLQGTDQVTVRDSRIAFNGIGIFAEPAANDRATNEHIRIVGNVLLGNAEGDAQSDTGADTGSGGGIILAGRGHTVTQNLLSASGRHGVWVLASDTTVADNRLEAGTGRGILVQGGTAVTVRENTLVAHAGTAIVGRETHRLTVSGNRLNGPGDEGIRVSEDHGTLVAENDIDALVHGIVSLQSRALTVRHNEVEGAKQAIDVVAGNDVQVASNRIEATIRGAVNLFGVQDVSLSENRVWRSAGHGIYVGKASRDVTLSSNDILTTARGLTIEGASQRIASSHDTIFGPCWVGVDVADAEDVHMTGLDVADCDQAVQLQRGSGHVLEDAVLVRNVVGVAIGAEAGPVHVTTSRLQGNQIGVHASDSSGHLVTSSDLSQNTQGVVLLGATGMELAHNWIRDNRIGLHFVNATGNLVYDNLVVNDALPGDQDHLMQNSPGNAWNVSDRAGTNVVGGPRIGGNLWRDYEGPDADQDGLGDVPYWPVPLQLPEGGIPGLALSLEGPLDMHPLVTDGDPEAGGAPSEGNDPRGDPGGGRPRLPLSAPGPRDVTGPAAGP